VIRRLNNRLLALDSKAEKTESRALSERWGRLHMVRTGLGLTAVVVMLATSVR
jgi:anthrone oxygenase-like protein